MPQGQLSFRRPARDGFGRVRLFLVLGAALFLAGQAVLATGSFPPTRGGAVTIQAGANWFYVVEIHLLGSGRVTVAYEELSGRVVDVHVFPASQYRVYAFIGLGYALYSEQGTSGDFAVDLPQAGAYYLVVDHGSGFEETQQDVRLTYRVAGIDPDFLFVGLGMVAAGIGFVVLDLKWAPRLRPARP